MSGKEHCSLGEALNPAVSSAVLAYCNRLCIKTEYVFLKMSLWDSLNKSL